MTCKCNLMVIPSITVDFNIMGKEGSIEYIRKRDNRKRIVIEGELEGFGRTAYFSPSALSVTRCVTRTVNGRE